MNTQDFMWTSQPDANGEFLSPLDGALFMAGLQIPQIPLRPKSKQAFLKDWPTAATTDFDQILKWASEHSGCNFGSVAKKDAHFVFESDSSKTSERFAEFGGAFTAKLAIQSRPGRGHRWYLSTPNVGNISQSYTKHGDFSLRADNAYCVSPGSLHPETGKQYCVVLGESPERPTEQEIAFWNSEKIEKEPNAEQDIPKDANGLIPHGHIHDFLVSFAGKLRNIGLTTEEIEPILLRKAHKECAPPIDESRVRQVARSMSIYKEGSLTGGQLIMRGVAKPEPVDWRSCFRSVGELEQGEVRMLVNGVLPEGTTFIGGLPGEGKSLLALSIAKALTTGEPFIGNFNVPEIIPVIYLIPESGARAFRRRCEAFHIPNNPDLFLCRTVSEGATLPLDDASLLEAVRRLQPVVILDTIIRFSESEDENAAMQNKKLVDDVLQLRQAGARGIIGLHHATKAMREKGMSLESALRGTGDIAACADAVYGLLRDSKKYDNNRGPNEIDVYCIKARDFDPPIPFRIAASQKVDTTSMTLGPAPGIVSVIDQHGDFVLVSKAAGEQTAGDRLEALVKDDPAITIEELAEVTGQSKWIVRTTLEKRGWVKNRGGAKGVNHWVRKDVGTIQGSPTVVVDLNAKSGVQAVA